MRVNRGSFGILIFFSIFNNTTISHSSTNMRNHSGFLVADLIQDSLPGQDLYGMVVKHDGNDMSRTPRRHIGLVVFGMEKHDGNDMSRTLRTHIDLVVFGMGIQIFKVILYSCCINIVTN